MLVSVVIPTLDRPKLLLRAIDSVSKLSWLLIGRTPKRSLRFER